MKTHIYCTNNINIKTMPSQNRAQSDGLSISKECLFLDVIYVIIIEGLLQKIITQSELIFS